MKRCNHFFNIFVQETRSRVRKGGGRISHCEYVNFRKPGESLLLTALIIYSPPSQHSYSRSLFDTNFLKCIRIKTCVARTHATSFLLGFWHVKCINEERSHGVETRAFTIVVSVGSVIMG